MTRTRYARGTRGLGHHAPGETNLSKFVQDPGLKGYSVLQKIFFAPTAASQAAVEAFVNRLMERKEDREPASGPGVAQAQVMAFRDWEKFTGKRFTDLAAISPADPRRERHS